MSVLKGLRTKIDWEKVFEWIIDIISKSAGLLCLFLIGPYITPNSLSYSLDILSGDITHVFKLIILTPALLRFCGWWSTQDDLVSKSYRYLIYGIALLQTSLVVLVGVFLVVRFGIITSVLAGSIIGLLCVSSYNPELFMEYLVALDIVKKLRGDVAIEEV